MPKIHLVRTNGIILGAYEMESHAHTHARTVTGGYVSSMDVLTRVPVTVADDVASDDWNEEDTPVVAEVPKEK